MQQTWLFVFKNKITAFQTKQKKILRTVRRRTLDKKTNNTKSKAETKGKLNILQHSNIDTTRPDHCGIQHKLY